MKVCFVGGPNDGLETELDLKLYPKPPATWTVPIPNEDGLLLQPGAKCWSYYYNSENKTYYVRRGVHDG